MQQSAKVLRQNKKAIIISYAVYRVWLAIVTYGILAVYDFLSYRNSKLVLREQSIELTTSALGSNTTPIPFEDITGFSVQKSALGRSFDYGKVKIHHKDSSVLSFRFVREPERVAHLLENRVKAVNPSVFGAAEYQKKLEESKAQAAQSSNVATRSGTCPRCGSDNLRAVSETRTKGVSTVNSTAGCCLCGPIGLLCGLPGAGRSHTMTRRMCLNCGKKF